MEIRVVERSWNDIRRDDMRRAISRTLRPFKSTLTVDEAMDILFTAAGKAGDQHAHIGQHAFHSTYHTYVETPANLASWASSCYKLKAKPCGCPCCELVKAMTEKGADWSAVPVNSYY